MKNKNFYTNNNIKAQAGINNKVCPFIFSSSALSGVTTIAFSVLNFLLKV
ncbi:hypothetical protein [Thermodesulfovibrio hydrogeniphilus]